MRYRVVCAYYFFSAAFISGGAYLTPPLLFILLSDMIRCLAPDRILFEQGVGLATHDMRLVLALFSLYRSPGLNRITLHNGFI
jgi:hypothetical protein